MKPSRSPAWPRYPIAVLCICVAVALSIRPHWGTAVLSVLVIGVGAGRSLARGESWTLADQVTTTRLGLIVIFCALGLPGPGFSWLAVTVGAVALALDGVDGFVARRTGSTVAGAIYDEAVDALFILLLGIGLVSLWGLWTVLPGTLYYLFHGVAFFRPTWRRSLPASKLRKTVAASQGVLLLSAGTPLAQTHCWLGLGAVGLALMALSVSFGRDIRWLEASAHQPRHGRPV